MSSPVEELHEELTDLATRVGVLGPMAVRVNGSDIVISARRQRAVLACLVAARNEAVSADRILESVWGDDVPSTGVRAVAFHVSRLRALLDSTLSAGESLIETSPAGYRACFDPEAVDCHRFDDLVRTARDVLSVDPLRCERTVLQALELWRGRPFVDLADEPFVETETRRLERSRALARRTLVEARLALGRPADVVAELHEMIEEEPLDEGLVRLLMIALRRSHRPADGLRAFGELRIRLGDELGIEPSHDLQQLEHELLTSSDPSPLPAPPNAVHPSRRKTASFVPTSLSSFVGRSTEIEAVAELLQSQRVVTLCGFGGLGKTRLAQETARLLAEHHPDGAWFIDLTIVADPAELADTALHALGVLPSGARDPMDELLQHVSERDLLIVLDNCEHLVDGVAAFVTALCGAGPDVHVLATSRTPLQIAGESRWPMGPLSPDDATLLFIDRARQSAPSLTLDDASDDEHERLRAQLDGIPLAIEIAASWLSVMTVRQIVDYLEGHRDVRGRANGEEDRGSLRTVIDWSLGLLSESDRDLLSRLTVCSSGFDLAAARTLAGPDCDIDDVIDGLGRLLDRALIVSEDAAGTRRFRILEAVRSAVGERLERAERARVCRRHAEHYESVAATVFDLWMSEPESMMRLGDAEVGNLRTAMSWAFANGCAGLGLSITRGARMYFWSRRMHRENLRWLLAGIAADGPIDGSDGSARGSDVLDAAAIALIESHSVGDRVAQATVWPLVDAGLSTVDDPNLRGNLLSAQAVHVQAVDPVAADRLHAESFELRAALGVPALPSLANRVETSWMTGTVAADEVLAGLHRITAELDSVPPLATKIEAGVAARRARWDDVLDLGAAMPTLDPATDVSVRLFMIEALIATGDHAEAAGALDRLEFEASGGQRIVADLLAASLDLSQASHRAAVRRLSNIVDGLDAEQQPQARAMPVSALLGVAAAGLGEVEASATLLGFSSAERSRLGTTLRPFERSLEGSAASGCCGALGAERFGELCAAGAAATWHDLPVDAVRS